KAGWRGKFCCIRMECRARAKCLFSLEWFAPNRQLKQNSCSSSRVQVRSVIMSDTATSATKQNPLQYINDQLKELREKGVAPRLRVLEGEQKPVCIFDGREVINLA